MKKVLVIDPDPTVSDELTIELRKHGFSVIAASSGKSGVRKALEESPRLIVLEVVLPDMSGFDLCKILNASPATKSTPIIFLSAKANEVDRILGFELGAVDYVTKPFSSREVLLRIKAIIQHDYGDTAEQQLMSREILLNQTRHQVAVNGKRVNLTAVEFKLLSYLMKTRGRLQARDRLLNEVWDYSSSLLQTRTVDNHVLRLRKKLGQAGRSIETIYGYGYRFTLAGSEFIAPGGSQAYGKSSPYQTPCPKRGRTNRMARPGADGRVRRSRDQKISKLTRWPIATEQYEQNDHEQGILAWLNRRNESVALRG